MEQADRAKKLIGAMVLTVLSGNLDVRVQYTGIVITNIERWIMNEKVTKDATAIQNVRMNLINTFNSIVQYQANIKVRAGNIKWEDDNKVRAIREQFKESCIVLDKSYDNQRAVIGTQCIKEMESLRVARDYFYGAAQAYSEFLSGSPSGFTNATTLIDKAIQIIFGVCSDNSLIDIDENSFRVAVAAHSKPQQPEPSKR